jgi:hypothetical protein
MKEEEKIEHVPPEKIGIFRIVWHSKGKNQAYVDISKKILEKWKEMGYNIRDLYVAVYMLVDGTIYMVPLMVSNLPEAKAEGFRFKGMNRMPSGKGDEKKEVR